MSKLPNCPKCSSEYTYEDGPLLMCPECAHEWSKDTPSASEQKETIIRDANGTVLQDGDDVVVIKDLKVKGSPNPIKQGTRARNIKLINEDGHDIACRVDGFGNMNLKSEFVKKA